MGRYKRTLSLALVCAVVIAMLPITALAAPPSHPTAIGTAISDLPPRLVDS